VPKWEVRGPGGRTWLGCGGMSEQNKKTLKKKMFFKGRGGLGGVGLKARD